MDGLVFSGRDNRPWCAEKKIISGSNSNQYSFGHKRFDFLMAMPMPDIKCHKENVLPQALPRELVREKYFGEMMRNVGCYCFAMFCNIWLEKGNHHEKHLRTCWAKKRLSFAHRYHKGSRSKNDCRSLCRTLTEAANKIGQHGKTMTLIANIQELHCLLKTWVLTFLLYHGLFATWADVAISASAEVQMPPARTFTFSTVSVTSSRVFASALMISLASTRTALICHQGIAGKWF